MKFPLSREQIQPFYERDGENSRDIGKAIIDAFKFYLKEETNTTGIVVNAVSNNIGILDFCFASEEDMNLFKLTNSIKEGEILLYNGDGIRMTSYISFTVLSEFYG